MRNLLPLTHRSAGVLLLTGALAAVGCASQTKVVQTPFYSLAHPDFWKVKSVAQKPAEPTVLTIGQYSTTIVDEGSGATGSSMYESSQADVEVRIFAWPEAAAPSEGSEANPTERVSKLLFGDPDLNLAKHSLIGDQSQECGKEFKRKYTVLGSDQAPYDLISRPGWRTIVVGGKSSGTLVGVVSRVPYEQDVGLYCHNLSNMRTQLQHVLTGLTPASNGGTASAAAPKPPTN